MEDRIILRAPDWLVAALASEAERRTISVSALIRQAIVRELDCTNEVENENTARGKNTK